MALYTSQRLSPAKINLFLHVTGKRADGYHGLHSLMCRVDLFDVVYFDFDTAEVSVKCLHPDVPEDHTNLACKAAQAFFQISGINGGVTLEIEKNIPVAGGLGGGSSNAAVVLKRLNQYYGCPLSDEKLSRVARSLGADVPFFLLDKPALASGIGDILKPLSGMDSMPVLLVNPGYKVPTGLIYKKLKLRLTKGQKTLNRFEFKKEEFNIVRVLGNDLEAVTLKLHPDLTEVKKQLIRYGALGALMSGSGPTIFGLFADIDTAQAAHRALGAEYEGQSYLCNLLTS